MSPTLFLRYKGDVIRQSNSMDPKDSVTKGDVLYSLEAPKSGTLNEYIFCFYGEICVKFLPLPSF